MDELYPLFFGNLSDSIPSVRQGAAMSLGNVVKAYGMLHICSLLYSQNSDKVTTKSGCLLRVVAHKNLTTEGLFQAPLLYASKFIAWDF